MTGYTLKQFIKESELIVREQSSEPQKLALLRPRLEQLMQTTGVPAQTFIPRQDRFAMNLVRMPEDKSFSIIAGVWKPGQTTPIHDHLTWALIGVYSGEEREALYKRTDDRKNPKYAKLEKVSEGIHTKGHVTVLNHTGIHKVDNISREPAESIHVYGQDIGNTERHSYDPITGEIGQVRLRILQRAQRRRALLARGGRFSTRQPSGSRKSIQFSSPSGNNKARKGLYQTGNCLWFWYGLTNELSRLS